MIFVPLVDNTTQGLGCYGPAAGLTNFTSNLAIFSISFFYCRYIITLSQLCYSAVNELNKTLTQVIYCMRVIFLTV